MYIIDKSLNEKYFIILVVSDLGEQELFKISKSSNTLESVKKIIGEENIKEIR